MPTRRNILLMIALAGSFAGKSAVAQKLERAPINGVATFSILADLVKNVAGDRVEVATLVGPNGDVHVFSPTPADAKTLSNAKVVFVNGLGLEGWMTRLISASGTTAAIVVASAGVTARQTVDGNDAGRLAPDPHAWQSIANAKVYVGNIRDGLSTADSGGKAVYEANAAAYLAKLDALEQAVMASIAKIPPDRRKVIVAHDAFGYFGDAYGVQFVSPEGVSTDSEPSARAVGMIVAQIRRQKIPAVFLENIADPRLMRQIANESGAKIGGTLYSDALSQPNGPAGSYIDMMRHNVSELDKALTP